MQPAFPDHIMTRLSSALTVVSFLIAPPAAAYDGKPALATPEILAPPGADTPISEPSADTPLLMAAIGFFRIRQERWLLAQDANHYTIRLARLPRESDVRRVIKTHGLKDQAAYYFYIDAKKRGWYDLLYGIYPEREAAEAAIANLPQALGDQAPVVRKLDRVHASIRETLERAAEEIEPRPYRQDGGREQADVPMAPREPGRYRTELGLSVRHNDNLFEAQAGSPKESDTITAVSARIDGDLLRGETSSLAGHLLARWNDYKEFDDADSAYIDAGLDYAFGKNTVRLAYFTTPERLAYLKKENVGNTEVVNSVLSEVRGVNLNFTRRENRRMRWRIGYEESRETYETDVDGTAGDRDYDRQELYGDVKYRVHETFRPGIGFELAELDAETSNYGRDESSLVLSIGSQWSRKFSTDFRYRYRIRDYTTDDQSDSNVDREDHRDDYRIYANLILNRQWRLFIFDSYIDNRSSRDSRTFTGNEVGIGIFYQFP